MNAAEWGQGKSLELVTKIDFQARKAYLGLPIQLQMPTSALWELAIIQHEWSEKNRPDPDTAG